MKPALAVAVVAVALGILAGLYLAVDHAPLHRHLIHLPSPAPSDHGWITPSTPGATR